MYQRILVPVDLAHKERLDKALSTAADMSKLYDAPVVYAGVTTGAASSVAHTPEEYSDKLAAFAAQEADRRGVRIAPMPLTSHDPAIDLERTLIKAIEETGADLVVMASHVPGVAEHIFASNAGNLASHAAVSVLVVR